VTSTTRLLDAFFIDAFPHDHFFSDPPAPTLKAEPPAPVKMERRPNRTRW